MKSKKARTLLSLMVMSMIVVLNTQGQRLKPGKPSTQRIQSVPSQPMPTQAKPIGPEPVPTQPVVPAQSVVLAKPLPVLPVVPAKPLQPVPSQPVPTQPLPVGPQPTPTPAPPALIHPTA